MNILKIISDNKGAYKKLLQIKKLEDKIDYKGKNRSQTIMWGKPKEMWNHSVSRLRVRCNVINKGSISMQMQVFVQFSYFVNIHFMSHRVEISSPYIFREYFHVLNFLRIDSCIIHVF